MLEIQAQAAAGKGSADSRLPLGQIMVEQGLVQPAVVEAALEKQQQQRKVKTKQQQSVRVDADKLDHLINLIGEVSEAWESFRAGTLAAPCDKAEKMAAMGLRPLTCLEEELADVVIRAFDTAQAFGLDLQTAVEVKHAYNGTRAPRHGGKLA